MAGVAPDKQKPRPLTEDAEFPQAIVRAILRDDRVVDKWNVAAALAAIVAAYNIVLDVGIAPMHDPDLKILKEEVHQLRQETGWAEICALIATTVVTQLRGASSQDKNVCWQYVGLLLFHWRRKATTVSK